MGGPHVEAFVEECKSSLEYFQRWKVQPIEVYHVGEKRENVNDEPTLQVNKKCKHSMQSLGHLGELGGERKWKRESLEGESKRRIFKSRERREKCHLLLGFCALNAHFPPHQPM